MLSIGYDYRVPVENVIAIVASDSAPIKRMIQRARENGVLHDCTKGKKTRSAVITTSEEAQPHMRMVRVSIGAEGGGAQDHQVQRSNRSGKAVHLQKK